MLLLLKLEAVASCRVNEKSSPPVHGTHVHFHEFLQARFSQECSRIGASSNAITMPTGKEGKSRSAVNVVWPRFGGSKEVEKDGRG